MPSRWMIFQSWKGSTDGRAEGPEREVVVRLMSEEHDEPAGWHADTESLPWPMRLTKNTSGWCREKD
jgi:hypothetical protein